MKRPIVKRLAVGAAILSTALLTVGGYAGYQRNRVVIPLRHAGSANEPAADVQLTVRGDRGTVERLERGDQRDVVVKPEGESGLELHYKLGQEQCRWGGGYIEPSGGYRVLLEVRGCGDVRDKATLWP